MVVGGGRVKRKCLGRFGVKVDELNLRVCVVNVRVLGWYRGSSSDFVLLVLF